MSISRNPSEQLNFPLSRGGEFTSEEAADGCRTKVSVLRDKVLRLVEDHGSLTPWEAQAILNIDIYIVRPRFTELGLLGKIVKTDDTRRGGPYNKSERVWTLGD